MLLAALFKPCAQLCLPLRPRKKPVPPVTMGNFPRPVISRNADRA
jgi:hypothetical protein